MTHPPRSHRRSLLAAVVLALVSSLLVLASVTPARATSSYLCTGYSTCAQEGYSHFGYRKAGEQMWWRMFSGHNCTNYVAYRLVKQGLSAERPWEGTGMAYNWGRANRDITDDTPMVGSVAWWNAGDGVGSSGHVAYVEKVLSRRRIVVSEDSWSGDFHWRTIKKVGGGWPTGFVHFDDRAVRAQEKPQIVGEPAVGTPMSVDLGRWTPSAAYDVQWLAGGDPIPGATAATFVPSPGQLRSRLSVKVAASARGYLPGKAATERTTRVSRGTMSVAARPTLSGTARVDEVLTLDTGSASPASGSREIRWFADGERIRGASSTRLRLTQQQIRRTITATVVHRREAYRNLQATTAATARVAAGRFEITEPFTLAGRAQVGRTLQVTPGTFAPADAEVTYAWLSGDQPIAGARGPAYDVGPDDLGRRLSVRVDLRRAGYRDASVVLPVADRVTTVPALTLRATGGDHRAVVVLRVAAPGVEAPSGRATVKIGGREVTGRVENGRLRLVVRDLEPGRRTVRVSYAGTRLIESARARAEVRVRRG